MTGDNPLVGVNDDGLGPRFPDMTATNDAELSGPGPIEPHSSRNRLREGVYVAVPGPNLESPAETRILRTIGADVVGMSTVPEVIVANPSGLRIAGAS